MSIAGYRKPSDLPKEIPVFPLDGALMLPRSDLPLNIFEPRYLNMIDDALSADRLIGMIQTAPGGTREAPGLQRVGAAGRLTSFTETDDGRYVIQLTGVCRFAVVRELEASKPYRRVEAAYDDFAGDLSRAGPPAEGFDRTELLGVLKRYLEVKDLKAEWGAIESAPAETLVNSLAMICPFDAAEKQALLEAADLRARRDALVTLMRLASAGSTGDDRGSLQ